MRCGHRMLTVLLVMLAVSSPGPVLSMTSQERLHLKNEAEDMFYHAYNAYMDNAFPADELMPLSCRGRYRGREPSRGDIDDAMGNFSLTLIDSLDMLVVVGDLQEFESAVRKVIETVKFDTDVVVSVFETNIRIIGGLVSGHVLSSLLQSQPQHGVMSWYRGELLNMAVDCANRLLPAFNSSTGLPYPRVNLRSGLRGLDSLQVTCTACAGSMILEFAALSRLTGEPVYEQKASKAMDVLWASRHRQSNLVGNVLNVNTGDWIRRDSGVGAGIDSYYEYVAKAYVLLGEDKYLERWHSHYSAVMKYLGTGPLMMDVHMHRPNTNSKHFVDALGAFWPGLQVLMGDLKPAIEHHEVLYQIMKRHNFIPEAITADFQVHWGQHLLRPEFVESTYFLYKATKDPYYLEAGKQVLNSLQKYARVTCGYAAVRDVRTLQHEDRMDSFVISETFKYLYLLFAEEEDLFLDMSKFVFTTEAHLLPLSLARLSNSTVVPVSEEFWEEEDEEVDYAQACPSSKFLFPSHSSLHAGAASLRKPLESLVEDTCPTKKVVRRKLTAEEFQSTSEEHQRMVKDMGISIIKLPDGRVQLLHTFANALSPEDGEEGLLFMQEMIELSKTSTTGSDSPPKQISFTAGGRQFKLQAGPAQFGPALKGSPVTAGLVMASHVRGCGGSLQNGDSMWGKIVIVERGDCMFVEKARVLQSLGAVGGIVMDNTEGTAADTSPLFAMSGDGVDDVQIPMVFLFMEEAKLLMKVFAGETDMRVTLEEKPDSVNVMHGNGKCSLYKEADTQRPKIVGLSKSCPRDNFGIKVINNKYCKKRQSRKMKTSKIENLTKSLLNIIQNIEGDELLNQLKDLQNLQSIISISNRIEKKKKKKLEARSPIGRKLLSLDQCDSENCLENDEADDDVKEKEEIEDESNLQNETYDEDENEEDYEQFDIDNENDEEEEDEDEEIDDEDLLDSDSLTELLANKDLSEKISTMNDVLDNIQRKFDLNLRDIDEDLYFSAIQSLIVYIYTIEEMQEVPNSKQSSEDLVLLQRLSDRMKLMKKTYLSLVTHFETFFSNAWEIFKEIIENKIFLDRSNKDSVDKINIFALNFHYAKEIDKIIRKREIEDEVDIIEEFKDDLDLMNQIYDHFGFGEETQDEGYFSRMLSGLVSEEEDDEETHKNRRLLSIAEEDPEGEGYCSKDDSDCESSSESFLLQKEVKVSDIDRPLTDIEVCDELLERALQLGEYSLQDEKLAVLTGTDKVKYIKSFISKLKQSRDIVAEYHQHLTNIKDAQDYHQCYKMLEAPLGKLKKQTGNTKWLKHLSSLIASNDKEVLSELTAMLQDQNPDSNSAAFRKRNLLSVKDDDFCQKDDVGCREKSSLTNHIKHSKKEQAVQNLKQELDDSFEEIKVRDDNKKGKKSALFLCQELLTKSEQEMTKFQKNESKNKNFKKMKPKQKIRIIREYMTQMTSVKTLFDEHQKLSKEIKDQNDKEICQPILQKSMVVLSSLHSESGKTNWFSEMTSLLSSDDPDIINEIQDIMQTFKF